MSTNFLTIRNFVLSPHFYFRNNNELNQLHTDTQISLTIRGHRV